MLENMYQNALQVPRPSGLQRCSGSPNCVCSMQQPGETGFVNAISVGGSIDRIELAVLGVAEELPRTRLIEYAQGYWHFEVTTRWMRFRDDLEFWLNEDSSLLHLRSASRVGYSDFGVNARRVERIKQLIEIEES